MMSYSQQYYRIVLLTKGGATYLQFHTGTAREAVRDGRSLNHGINLNIADSHRVAAIVLDWQEQIRNFKLLPA